MVWPFFVARRWADAKFSAVANLDSANPERFVYLHEGAVFVCLGFIHHILDFSRCSPGRLL